MTWFVNVATNVVLGTAVTPGSPSRESVLAAVRAAISTEDPYGPAGGLPEAARVDRGKDFLSKTVAAWERPRVLVCDEAQWLSRECLEFWRHLWDDPRTDVAIVFVGGGDCYQRTSIRDRLPIRSRPPRSAGARWHIAARWRPPGSTDGPGCGSGCPTSSPGLFRTRCGTSCSR